MKDLTKEERSLLLCLETRAVDYGGTVDARHMNQDDFKPDATAPFPEAYGSAILVVCPKCKTKQELGGGLYAKSDGNTYTFQVCAVCETKQWCKWESPNGGHQR